MPEYILPTENAGADWHALDDFTKGFIEAAFFCDTSCYSASEFFTDEAQERVCEGQADGSIPSDAGPEDIEPDSLEAVTRLCREFQTTNSELLAEACASGDYDESQAGRDFYFTRAGHGVGYWDREQLKATGDDAEEYERLTAEMVAAGRDNAAWDKACEARAAVEARGVGNRLTVAAGRHEISLDAYQDDKAPSGFYVTFYC